MAGEDTPYPPDVNELAYHLIDLDENLRKGYGFPAQWSTPAWQNEVTIAQSLTLGSKLKRDDITRVSFGGAGLSPSYLYVTYLNDPFVLGIDREGRASS
jgi:hypothetical protein